eukprot:5822563-Prymnesium_polylepis.1
MQHAPCGRHCDSLRARRLRSLVSATQIGVSPSASFGGGCAPLRRRLVAARCGGGALWAPC